MLDLFLAELKRSWTIVWRYPLQAASGLLLTLILFMTLLAGIRYVAGPMSQFGDRLDTMIVGYVLWNTLVFAMGEIASGVEGEGRIGTLEQLFLSPLSGTRIFLVRALAGQTVVLVLNLGILGILLLVTGTRLHFPAALLLPLATAVSACYGIGLSLGALALVYKRVAPIIQMSQFALIALIMVPFETWHAGSANPFFLLPLVPSAALLRDLMARGQALDPFVLAVAAANAAVFLSLGAVLFHVAERAVKRQGMLGSY